jgi:hypothetical protein
MWCFESHFDRKPLFWVRLKVCGFVYFRVWKNARERRKVFYYYIYMYHVHKNDPIKGEMRNLRGSLSIKKIGMRYFEINLPHKIHEFNNGRIGESKKCRESQRNFTLAHSLRDRYLFILYYQFHSMCKSGVMCQFIFIRSLKDTQSV